MTMFTAVTFRSLERRQKADAFDSKEICPCCVIKAKRAKMGDKKRPSGEYHNNQAVFRATVTDRCVIKLMRQTPTLWRLDEVFARKPKNATGFLIGEKACFFTRFRQH